NVIGLQISGYDTNSSPPTLNNVDILNKIPFEGKDCTVNTIYATITSGLDTNTSTNTSKKLKLANNYTVSILRSTNGGDSFAALGYVNLPQGGNYHGNAALDSTTTINSGDILAFGVVQYYYDGSTVQHPPDDTSDDNPPEPYHATASIVFE